MGDIRAEWRPAMKIRKFYPFLFLSMILLLCIQPDLYARTENKSDRTFDLGRDGKVYLEFKTGNVVINSWNKNEVEIIAHEDSVIDVNHTPENIRISFRRSPSSHFKVFIPDTAYLRVETTSGRVKAGEMGGHVDIRTTSGDVEVLSAKSGVRCRTVSGDIDIGGVIGRADLKTTSGDITGESIQGSVKAYTVSGNIRIDAFSRAEEIEIETISGNIKLRGELIPRGICELNSHSGNIEIGLPADSSFELRTDTFSGSLDCDFDLKLSGIIDRKKIEGKIGNGGARLILSSFSGNIRIKKR